MHRLIRQIRDISAIPLMVLVLGLGAIGLSGCMEEAGSPQKNERKTQQNNYAGLVARQPAHTMGYSPTRETINFWIDTWKSPGKLSYVYLQSANGDLIGYYIFKGLPVSYCASQTPNYTWVDTPGSDVWSMANAPSIDGVYYSGGQCNTFYGRDASNNAYIEYTAGLGINVLLYDRPLARQDAKPLGFATIGGVK